MFLKLLDRWQISFLFLSFSLLCGITSHAQNIGSVRAQLKAPSKQIHTVQALSVTQGQASEKASLKSYRQWKNDKIQEAMAKVTFSKSLIEVRKIAQTSKSKMEAVTMKDLNTTQIESQIKADLMALEMAKDLTVSDYFAGYLSKLPHRSDAVKEIAQKMTSEEVAELMMAYSNSLFGSSPAGLPVQAQQGLGR